MRKNFGAKPVIYPQPVFIIGTYCEDGRADAMNAAWGGISEADEISMCLSAGHLTVKNIIKRGAFTVSMGTLDTVVPCDYVGLVSGKDEEKKLEKAGFTPLGSEFVDAPLFKELPMAAECTLVSYNEETCRLVGRVVNVSADESVLTDGKVDPGKLRPITYDGMNRAYYVLGEKVGDAFKDGTKLQ